MAAALSPEEATAAYTEATQKFGTDGTFDNLNDMCNKGINKLTVNITNAITTNKKANLLAEIDNVKAVFDELIKSTGLIEALPEFQMSEYKSKFANLYKTLNEGAESLATLLATAETKADLNIDDADTNKIKSQKEFLKSKAEELTAKKDGKPPTAAAAAGAVAVSGAELAKYKELLRTLTENDVTVTTLANAVATSIQTISKGKDKDKPAGAVAGGTQRVGTKKRKRRKRRGKGTGKNTPLSEVNVVL